MGPASQVPSEVHGDPTQLLFIPAPKSPAVLTSHQPADLGSDFSSDNPDISEGPSMHGDSSLSSDMADTAEGPTQSSSQLDSSTNSGDNMIGEKALLNAFEYNSDESFGYCRNCTNRLHETYCGACGYSVEEVTALLECTTMPDSPVLPKSTAQLPMALLWDERMEAHEYGCSSPHPERPDRIRAIMARLQASGLTDGCRRVECPEATLEQLARVHTADLIDYVKAMSLGLPVPEGYDGQVLNDTYYNYATFTAARLAAGGAAAVAAMVARGEVAGGAAIVRPPGHHAESNMAMGFCFFNNAAVAARAAQAAGAQRVLILDWDIHHGNGTQHIFEDDPSVMYMSLHRWDDGAFYPGTGSSREVGVGLGEGYTVNVAWNGGNLHNMDYMWAFDSVLIPVARSYRPDLIIVSAGFDAADGDPIGGCRVTAEGFAHMTAALKNIAPLVLLLEGGYNLYATANSTEACLRVLLGEPAPPLPGPHLPSRAGAHGVLNALYVQRHYWPCLRGGYTELLMKLERMGLIRGSPSDSASDGACEHTVSTSYGLDATASTAPSAAQTMSGIPLLLKQNPSWTATDNRYRRMHHHRSHIPHGSPSRKRQLLFQIRRKAQQAWWLRHQRIVKARSAAAPLKQKAWSAPQQNIQERHQPPHVPDKAWFLFANCVSSSS